MDKAKTTYVEILNPAYQKSNNGPSLRDYITVPRLSLRGSYSVLDLLSESSVGATLDIYRKLQHEMHEHMASFHKPHKRKKPA